MRLGLGIAASVAVLGASAAVAAVLSSGKPNDTTSPKPLGVQAGLDSAAKVRDSVRKDSTAKADSAKALRDAMARAAKPLLSATKPPKPALTRAQRDSIKLARAPEPEDTLRQAIKKPFDSFAGEWARGDSTSLRAYAGIEDTTVGRLRKFISNVEGLRPEIVKLDFDRDSAKAVDTLQVQLRIRLHFKPRGSNDPRIYNTDFAAVVARAPNGWLINRIYTKPE